MPTITPTQPAPAAPATISTGIGADFTMFLKLLTTQMQNQDPLDPMDTAQYTQQLVQYSQVEQSVAQTGTLKSILESLSAQNLTQASGMIGREATFDSKISGLSATGPATWSYSADATPAVLTATITAADGRVVDTREIMPSGRSGRFAWDGMLSGGRMAPTGDYSLTLTATGAGGAGIPVDIRSTGVVREVRSGLAGLELSVNGTAHPAATLLGIGG